MQGHSNPRLIVMANIHLLVIFGTKEKPKKKNSKNQQTHNNETMHHSFKIQMRTSNTLIAFAKDESLRKL